MPFEMFPVAGPDRGPLRAILPIEGTARFDPFLVLHEQGPVRYGPGQAVGFDDHPHRGFETINYIIEGEQTHRDSHGHAGVIESGGMQWMTAAAGIVHAELPTERMRLEGGTMHAFQIWLNLPRVEKMAKPRYQEFRAEDLPVVRSRGAWIRLLAGAHGTVKAPVHTGVPALIAHVRLEPRADVAFEVVDGATTIVYAMRGSAQLGPQPLGSGVVAISRDRRSHVALGANERGFEGLLLSATPIGEPVVSDGPFVMTTREEIDRAYEDLRLGLFAREAATG